MLRDDDDVDDEERFLKDSWIYFFLKWTIPGPFLFFLVF